MLHYITLMVCLPYLIYCQQSTWIYDQRQQLSEKNHNQPCALKIVSKCFKKFDKYSNQKYSVGILSSNNGLDDLCK